MLTVIEADPDRMTGPPGAHPGGELVPWRDAAGRVGRLDARRADGGRAGRRLHRSFAAQQRGEKPAIVQLPPPVVPATRTARKQGETTSRSHHASGFSDMRSQNSRTRAGEAEVRT